MRSVDQGFDESVVHREGGIGQPSDPPDGSDYFDPILFHNGEQERYRGCVTDILVDEALVQALSFSQPAPPEAPLELGSRTCHSNRVAAGSKPV